MNTYVYYGIITVLAANYIQIAEEWKQRGLTDTSYKVIGLLFLGPLAIAYGFHQQHQHMEMYIAGGFAGIAAIMGATKLKDHLKSRMRIV